MPLAVYTSRLPHKGHAGYHGRDAVDVTRSARPAYGGAFAPSKDLSSEWERRKREARGDETRLRMLWSWYEPLFIEEMRASYTRNRAAWRAMLAREGDVTLCCYCATSHRCHRRTLAGILVAAGRRLGIVVTDLGERL